MQNVDSDINSPTIYSIPSSPPPPPPVVTIKEGKLEFPNGKTYTINHLKIGGKEVDLSGPLTEHQLKAVQTFVNSVFSKIDGNVFAQTDLKSLNIQTSTPGSLAVKVDYVNKKNQLMGVQDQDAVHDLRNNFFNHQVSQEESSKFKSIDKTAAQALSPPYEEELTGTPGPERPLVDCPKILLNQETPPPASTMTHHYVKDGEIIATQTVTRFDTINANTAFCKNMIDQCEGKLKNPAISQREKIEIQTRLNYYKTALKNSENFAEVQNGKDWVRSSYFRDIINSFKSFGIAVQNYVSAPVNMRFQELSLNGVKTGFMRMGIISDMRNGWFSMSDLNLIKEQGDKRSSTFLDQKIAELEARKIPPPLFQKLGIRSDNKILQILGFVLNSQQMESIDYALNQLKIIKGDPKGIDAIILERKIVLEQQMVQLVVNQIKSNPELVKQAIETGNFDLLHVSLLNQRSSSLDGSGWMHDERVEMEDMNEIFKELKGKTLAFNGKGPSIDGNVISLPADCLPEGIALPAKEIKLRTFFINLSVQGNIKNNGTQLRINQETMRELAVAHPDMAKNEILNPKHDSGYGPAEDFLLQALLHKKMAVSLGCLSAKDRTGFISERLMIRQLPKEVQSLFEKKIFDSDSPAVKIVLENTPGYRALKVAAGREKWRGFTEAHKVSETANIIFQEMKLRTFGPGKEEAETPVNEN
ncbi:MAG: hypothetical protein LW832_08455 [Parachlamydia sp.]|nr:hypothetical protein [Parachlamydia sp.]